MTIDWQEPALIGSGADPAGPTSAEVTIVLITHDAARWKYLEKSVASALAQRAGGLVIGVDHNPLLAERIRLHWPQAQVVPNRFARGASGTRNSAAEAVATSLTAFLDDDVVAAPDWLEMLLEPLADPSVVGAGGRITPIWQSAEPRWFPREFGWVIGTSYRGQPSVTGPVRNVWGGNMLVRTEVFRKVGGFNADFGKVGARAQPEDTEMCIRAAAAVTGGRWMYVPKSAVGHQVPPSSTRFSYFLARSFQEGRGKIELQQVATGDDVLDDERSYLTRTLPAGIRRGLTDALGGDVAGVARAGMIVAGMGAAGVGAVAGRAKAAPARAALQGTPDSEAARAVLGGVEPPVWVGELQLDGEVAQQIEVGPDYRWARILPRLGWAVGQPVLVPVVDGHVSTEEVRAACADWDPAAADRQPALVPENLSVAVTISTRNRPEQLRRMLESLRRIEQQVSVLVIDNAPSDDRTRMVVDELAARDPRIRYLLEPRPGLSVARNRALSETTADVLLFTDDDVEVDSQWVAVHAAAFADPEVTVSTGQAFAARLDVRDELLSEMTIAWNKGSVSRTFSLADPPADVPIFPFSPGVLGGGLNFGVRVSRARAIGGFDETLGAGSAMRGGEDCDFMIRSVRQGGTVRYSPRSFVWHHHRQEPGDFERQRADSAVGLGAYLGKLALQPSAMIQLARRLPAGLRHYRHLRATAERGGADQNEQHSELLSVLRGATGYHLARRRVRRAGGHTADRPL